MGSGNSYTLPCLICSIEERLTKKDKPYLLLELSDETASHKVCRFWDMCKDEFTLKVGDLGYFEIKTNLYDGEISFTVTNYRQLLGNENIDKELFIKSAPLTGEEMYDFLIKTVNNFSDVQFKKLTLTILEDNKEKLLYWSAAKSIHHNMRGGLLYHVRKMVDSAIALHEIYPQFFNYDLLVTGIILHDIGKLVELNTDEFGNAVYTIAGNLIGHVNLGYRLVSDYCERLNIDSDHELEIAHIILSHHGSLEHGSAKIPSTPEAIIVSKLDSIDASSNQCREIISDLEPGTFSNNVLGLNTKIYRSNLQEK